MKPECKVNVFWSRMDTAVQGSSRKTGGQDAVTTSSSSWQIFSMWDRSQCLTSHNRWEVCLSCDSMRRSATESLLPRGTPKGAAAHLPNSDSRKTPTQGNDPFFTSPFSQQLGETMKTPGNPFSDSWAGIKASTDNWENENVPPKYCWGKKALLHYSTSKGTAGWAIQSTLAAFPRRLILPGSVDNKAQWGGTAPSRATLWESCTTLRSAKAVGRELPVQLQSRLCSDSPTCDKGNSSLVLKACGH